jgi:hypothetical protein
LSHVDVTQDQSQTCVISSVGTASRARVRHADLWSLAAASGCGATDRFRCRASMSGRMPERSVSTSLAAYLWSQVTGSRCRPWMFWWPGRSGMSSGGTARGSVGNRVNNAGRRRASRLGPVAGRGTGGWPCPKARCPVAFRCTSSVSGSANLSGSVGGRRSDRRQELDEVRGHQARATISSGWMGDRDCLAHNDARSRPYARGFVSRSVASWGVMSAPRW